jgi:hypothetical protein
MRCCCLPRSPLVDATCICFCIIWRFQTRTPTKTAASCTSPRSGAPPSLMPRHPCNSGRHRPSSHISSSKPFPPIELPWDQLTSFYCQGARVADFLSVARRAPDLRLDFDRCAAKVDKCRWCSKDTCPRPRPRAATTCLRSRARRRRTLPLYRLCLHLCFPFLQISQHKERKMKDEA